MSVDNVYLSIVNDSGARAKLVVYKNNRIFRNESLYKYKHPSMLELANLAHVKGDFLNLSANEQKEAWKLIIDYVYGDELAGLTNNKHDTSCGVGTNLKINIKEKETKMGVTTKTIHTVNGTDVTTMTPDDLIRCIKNVEQEIKELKAINIQSNYILKKVEELQATLVVVVGHLDAK